MVKCSKMFYLNINDGGVVNFYNSYLRDEERISSSNVNMVSEVHRVRA